MSLWSLWGGSPPMLTVGCSQIGYFPLTKPWPDKVRRLIHILHLQLQLFSAFQTFALWDPFSLYSDLEHCVWIVAFGRNLGKESFHRDHSKAVSVRDETVWPGNNRWQDSSRSTWAWQGKQSDQSTFCHWRHESSWLQRKRAVCNIQGMRLQQWRWFWQLWYPFVVWRPFVVEAGWAAFSVSEKGFR